MTPLRFAAAAGTALVLTACSIGKPIPRPTTFLIEPPAPQTQPDSSRRADSMSMGNVRVAAAFAGDELVYRMGDVRYTSDPYNTFITEPAAMLSNQIATWLAASGPFRAVRQPGGARLAHYVLEATVTELYGDFRPEQSPAAVLAVEFVLLDTSAGRPRVVLERMLKSRVTLSAASPDALVRGYGEALGEVLTQLVGELGTVGSEAPS